MADWIDEDPPKVAEDRREFEFQPNGDGSLTLEDAVFQAIGAGSTCWENLSDAGAYDPFRAVEIGNKLLEFIREKS